MNEGEVDEEGQDAAQKQRDHKRRQRARRKEEHNATCVQVVERCKTLLDLFPLQPLPEGRFEWHDMPPSLQPSHNLTGERAANKQQQCESFARALETLVDRSAGRRLRVVDFGSGTGNASLPLTWWFRDVCDFVLVDRFDEPIRIAKERVAAAQVTHVQCVVSYISAVEMEPFDIGFSSHACGQATDHALLACLKCDASFCLTSCCVGKIRAEEQDTILPRSLAMQAVATREEFLALARSGEHDCNQEWSALKSDCKLCLEVDRMCLARESNSYESIWRTRLEPPSCSPKNDCIVGKKRR